MKNKKIKGDGKIYVIKDMNCQHCVKKVDSIVRSFETVEDVKIDLKHAKVEIDGEFNENELLDMLENAGYPAVKSE